MLLLIVVGLGCPADFLADIGHRFSKCHLAIPVDIGFAAQCPQEILCEQPVPMPVVLQSLPDITGSNEVDGRASYGIPLGEGSLRSVGWPQRRHDSIEQKQGMFRL